MTHVRRALAANLLAVSLLAWAGTGCSLDNLLKNDEVPPNVTDPAITETPTGALAAYHGTVAQFRLAFGGVDSIGGFSFVDHTGTLSDELRDLSSGVLDRRILPEPNSFVGLGPFVQLQKVRGQAAQAIGLLTRYAPPEQRALIGHAYALEGYAEIMLAELFCSGIPLSTLDFDGDYTYRPGSTTAEVLTHAGALFDTALTFAGDSARFVHLVAVGKARALLGLGQYAAASEAVVAVPDDYRYDVTYSAATGANATNFANANRFRTSDGFWIFSVADQEGGNGLDYVTSRDPPAAATLQGTTRDGFTSNYPKKYARDGSSPIVLASGVEARLIAAEAALQANAADLQWLATLNHLRQTAWPSIQDCSSGTCLPGATEPLPNLDDPGQDANGTDSLRVDLLFRERAFWLFLTGHRQGDLRRLIRQYGRTQERLYPVGPYPGDKFGKSYGSEVTVPIPSAERVANRLFTGCISRDA